MENVWKYVYWNNTVGAWTKAFALLVVCVLVINAVQYVIAKSLRRFSENTKTTWDDFLIEQIEQAILPLGYFVSFYLAISTLQISAGFRSVMQKVVIVVASFFILKVIAGILTELIRSFLQHGGDKSVKENQSKGLIIIVNVIVWVIGALFVVGNFGYDVTAFIAGLGIGGIAIALAAQTILGDLFNYFVIFFDKPFEIGDFIVVEDKMGIVEHVGIKTTRIRALSGEQLICSNTNLTSSRLHNYKRMDRRRVVFKLGLIYNTPSVKAKELPYLVKQIIEDYKDVTFDRGHFSGFGDSSLDFEFVYYVESSDYNFYMDQQQSIYLDIMALFEKEGLEFAYPTQSLFINSKPASVDA